VLFRSDPANAGRRPVRDERPAAASWARAAHDAARGIRTKSETRGRLRACSCWGGETELLFQVADALSKDAPAVVVLLAGGKNSRGEMLEAVQRAWPIVVVRGFGG